MATYLYLLKALSNPSVEDIVSTVRAGPAYGTSTTDPRGNLLTLTEFKNKYHTASDLLFLDNSNGTPYALVIFGAAEQGNSKTYADLLANPSWQAIDRICSSVGPLKAVTAKGKFGTPHTKYLVMVGCEKYTGFPKGAQTLTSTAYGFINSGTPWFKREKMDNYFR